FTLAALGQMILPTSGGGPQVTSSGDRSYYLTVAAKNVPMVANTAPFVTDGAQLSMDRRLAGQDDGGHAARYLDLVRARVTGAYASPVSVVSRTVGLIGGGSVFVLDELTTTSSVSLSLPFHGRGTRTSSAGTVAQTTWTLSDVALELTAVGAPTPSINTVAGHTTISYGTEEAVDGVELRSSATSPRVLSLFVPRLAASSAPSVEDRSAQSSLSSTLALRLTNGSTADHLLVLPGGTATVDGVTTDANVSSVRETSGSLAAFGLAQGTTLAFSGDPWFTSAAPLTLSATYGDTWMVAELSADTSGAQSFTLHGLGAFAPGLAWTATFNGAPLTPAQFTATASGLVFKGLSGGGTLRVERGGQVFDALADQSVSEGATLAFTVTANVPGGTTSTYSVASVETLSGPAPLIDPVSGAFTWTPGFDVVSHAATREVTLLFSVTTDAFTASVPCLVHVADVNRAPVVQPIADVSVQRGAHAHVAPVGLDPDGDALAWSYASSSTLSGAALDAASGAFDWDVPADAALGPIALTFSASDGHLSAQATMTLTITAAAPDGGSGSDGGTASDGGSGGPDGGSTGSDAGEGGTTTTRGGCASTDPALLSLLGLCVIALRRRTTQV
ncbi:MAG: hypothetical protein JST92_13420, partial [Deltaproteobacteria bacterium]|nr:hypothetical protein [Deltaproteobacteria bacterium]